jgi:hypothetical protein
MAFGMPDFEQILYKVRLAKGEAARDASRVNSNTELKGPLLRYSLDFAVSAQDLTLENSAAGVRHGNIEVMLVAYDRDGGAPEFISQKERDCAEPESLSGGDAGRLANSSRD